jgi:hypothetical protein
MDNTNMSSQTERGNWPAGKLSRTRGWSQVSQSLLWEDIVCNYSLLSAMVYVCVVTEVTVCQMFEKTPILRPSCPTRGAIKNVGGEDV